MWTYPSPIGMHLNLRLILVFGLLAFLAACGDPTPAPTLELQHPDTLKLETGNSQKLQYKLSNLSDTQVEWSSSNAQIASVDHIVVTRSLIGESAMKMKLTLAARIEAPARA